MTKFEELTDTPTQGNNATSLPEADQADDGRLSTIYEESEADLEAHILETWYTELLEEKQLLEATPIEAFYTIPMQMVPDNSVLVTVSDEQQGHLPTRGSPQDSDAVETLHVPLCSTDNDNSHGLDFDEHGRYVEICFTAAMWKVVLSEQQDKLLDVGRDTTMRVYVAAAAKRAVVVKEDDLLTKADIQANPVKVSKTLYTELKTWFDNNASKCKRYHNHQTS